MRQKSLNENIKSREQSKGDMSSEIDDIDDLLDDEGWDILNSLTEEELAQLNCDFDPENMLIPTGERINHERHQPGAKKTIEPKEITPMFSQKDLRKTLDAKLGQKHSSAALTVNSTLPPDEIKDGKTLFNQKDLIDKMNEMVAQSKPVIKNEKIRQKEEERRKQKEQELDKRFKGANADDQSNQKVILTEEEEELLADATEEELIEAAALLNMNDILTSEQINAVFAGDKPVGGISSNVKGTLPKQARITKQDEETELDVVALNRHLKQDTDDLFFLCVNNQPKLEKQTLELIINSVATSKKIKHLSLSMIGLADKQCIQLSEAIAANEQIETLNLDSNIIGMPGIEALMNVVSEHPTIREIKVSNQKQPFGGQGEECMASAVVKNQNILKFGYSFKQAAPRNKVDRAIIRNNEVLRHKRRNGEEVYDLKAVCKVRDPWPQPWIRVKGQRLLGSQLENKVTDMGLMIDLDADVGRESRGPKVREEREAKPLDIAALLAARANKLKGSKVAELDKESEERRKKTLLLMKQSEEESGRVGTMLKKGPVPNDKQESKPKQTLTSGDKETSPPAKAQEKAKKDDESTKQDEKKVGAKVSTLGDEGPVGRKKKGDTEVPEDDLKSKKKPEKKEVEEEEKPPPPKQSTEEKKGSKVVARLDEKESTPRRRRKKSEDEEEIDPFKGLPKKEEKKEPAPSDDKTNEKEKNDEEDRKKKLSDLSAAKKVVVPPVEETSTPLRRRKTKVVDEEPEPEFLKNTDEEPSKQDDSEKPLSAAEERAKALKERREALAAKKAGMTPKPEGDSSEKTQSAADRAKALKERREALAAKKAGGAAQPSADTSVSSAEEGAGSLKEGREKLAERKSAMKPAGEGTTTEKPKIDIASSLDTTEDKALSLKERRALLAEKKRLMGK